MHAILLFQERIRQFYESLGLMVRKTKTMNNDLLKAWEELDVRLGFYLGRLIGEPLIPPEHLYFSLTTRCNLKCIMCDVVKNPSTKENELSTLQVQDIVRQAKQLNINHLIFSGGEPFLRKDLCDLVAFSTHLGIRMVDIISNGTLIDDESIKRLIGAGLNHITVSLDGLKEVNDSLRGKGSFEKAENAIDKINYFKAQAGVVLPTVGINFTVMDRNIGDMLPMTEFARRKKCNIIVFQPVLGNNTKMYENKEGAVWPDAGNISQLKEILDQIISLKHTMGNPQIFTDEVILKAMPDYFSAKRLKKGFKCYEGIKRVVVTSDGKLWSCVDIYADLKKEDLKTAWSSFNAEKVRKKVRKCRKYCLQDCVYFPYDLRKDIRFFLLKFPFGGEEAAGFIRERIAPKLEFYLRSLHQRKGKGFFDILQSLAVAQTSHRLRQFKDTLYRHKD